MPPPSLPPRATPFLLVARGAPPPLAAMQPSSSGIGRSVGPLLQQRWQIHGRRWNPDGVPSDVALTTSMPPFLCAWLDGRLDDAHDSADYDNGLQIRGGGTRWQQCRWVDGGASLMGWAGLAMGFCFFKKENIFSEVDTWTPLEIYRFLQWQEIGGGLTVRL